MASQISVSEWYERTTENGTIQRRKFNSVSLSKSRIARQMVAAEGWVKSAGAPVGVAPAKAEKPKKAKPVEPDEQPEQNVEIA